MNVSDREVLIDYFLGRLSESEAVATRAKAANDAEFARTFEELRREFAEVGRGRFDAASSPATPPDASGSQNDARNANRLPNRRRKNRFAFVPKRVVAPRRPDVPALLAKKATVGVVPKAARPLRRDDARRLFSPTNSTFATRPRPFDAAEFSRTFVFSPTVVASIRGARSETTDADLVFVAAPTQEPPTSDETAAFVVPRELDAAPTFRFDVATPFRADATDVFARLEAPSFSAFDAPATLAARPVAFDAVATVGLDRRDTFDVFATSTSTPTVAQDPSKPETPSLAPSPATAQTSPLAPSPTTPEPFQPDAFARSEDVDETPSVETSSFAPQENAVYYGVDSDPEDEDAAPTISAEDRFLAEALGRTPSKFDREEYYWETFDEDGALGDADERAPRPTNPLLLAARFVGGAATAPVVAVGRATLGLFGYYRARELVRGEEFDETQNAASSARRKPGQASDMMISVVAGVLIAALVVFPFLRLVVLEVFHVIAKSAVRKIGQNVTLTERTSQADLLPFISEQMLYPRYEAVEFSDGSDGAATAPRETSSAESAPVSLASPIPVPLVPPVSLAPPAPFAEEARGAAGNAVDFGPPLETSTISAGTDSDVR